MIDESDNCGQLTMSPVSARGRRVTVLPSTSRFVPIEPSTNSLQQGQGYYQLSVFTKSQSHHNSQWINLTCHCLHLCKCILCSVHFSRNPFCKFFFVWSFPPCCATSIRGRFWCWLTQGCPPMPRAWEVFTTPPPPARTLGAAAAGCIGKYVLSLVRPCCRAPPLITAFSYPLAEGKRLQTSQKNVEVSKNCIW